MGNVIQHLKKGTLKICCEINLLCVPWQIYYIVIGFSGGESGSADTARDPRGFAMKFYTEDGNWDLVGNNTPIFFIRDPMQVSSQTRFVHVFGLSFERPYLKQGPNLLFMRIMVRFI